MKKKRRRNEKENMLLENILELNLTTWTENLYSDLKLIGVYIAAK